MKKRTLSTLLKNKTRSYSAQAAITSFVIHLLLVIFAGSIVAVKYVQKQNAMLIAQTESRPKLERKKIQAPARVEQLQKRALTSKLISKKVSVANPEFVLPDTGKISSLKTQKISLPGTDVGRALSSLSRVSGIGPSRIDFFGVRAEGEKAVFIIDASAAMLDERTGGLATYDYIKSELAEIVSKLKPTMLFNLILYDQQRVCMFRPNLVPATREISGELAAWIQSVNSDPAQAGLSPERNNYQAPVLYETAVGSDAQGWVLALQAALEQQPDTALLLGSGWGRHPISEEKAARLLEYALWEMLAGNVVSSAPALTSDRKLRDDLLKEASVALQQEDKLRASKTIPTGFVRDIAHYVEYSKNQIMEHLDFICLVACKEQVPRPPDIHFVCLTETANQVVAGGTVRHLWALTRKFNGKLEFLRRDPAVIGNSESSTGQNSEVVAATARNSPLTFFGTSGAGSRVAFILDASDKMLPTEGGGTFSYRFIKDQIQKAAAEIQPSAQFNVILHDGKKLALFQPEMVLANPENISALTDWIQPVNSDPLQLGIPDRLVSDPVLKNYGTAVGTDSSGWLRALQVAMEQQSDLVFLMGPGWSDQPVSLEKGRKLLDFSVWNSWGGGGGTVGSADETETTEEVDEDGNVTATTVTTTAGSAASTSLGSINGMQQDKKQRDALLKEALKAIEKEERQRKIKKIPQPFVRDVRSYLRYAVPQITEHLSSIVQVEYIAGNRAKPIINYICLELAEAPGTATSDRNLRKLITDYEGSLIPFYGADSREKMKEFNRSLDSMDWQIPPETP